MLTLHDSMSATFDFRLLRWTQRLKLVWFALTGKPFEVDKLIVSREFLRTL